MREFASVRGSPLTARIVLRLKLRVNYLVVGKGVFV